jgi:hypothetical protein
MTPKKAKKIEEAKALVEKMTNAELLSRYMSEDACRGSDYYYNTNYALLYVSKAELAKRFKACGFFNGTETGWDEDILNDPNFDFEDYYDN